MKSENAYSRSSLVGLLFAGLIFLTVTLASGVSVYSQECTVGTRIEFEDGERGIATIVEIGTKSPYVGSYLLTFSWNPKGDWYDPRKWGMRIAGTNTKCGPPATAVTPVPGGKASAAAPQLEGCPLVEPPGSVTKTSTASAQLFKRVIYERAAARVNPASISAPKKVGLTFLDFKMGSPYKNTLTSSRFGDKRRHDGAPVGAMIYPLKATEMQCDLHGESIRRTVEEVERNCFKNRSGEWTCPGRTTRSIERKLIPRN